MPQIKRGWSPHPKQRAIMADTTRFRVVPAGRRFGKTLMARREAAERALSAPNQYIWYMAPTDEDARELAFEPLRNELPASVFAGKPKETPPREIRFTNGSRISFRSARSQSRGRGIDHVVVEEAGEQENDVWYAVLRPSLSDTLGTALIIGTPKGRNWFYELYSRGLDPTDTEVSSWHATTYDNPHVADSEIEQARATLPERVFRQEYLAEFLGDEGEVFGNVRDRNTRPYALGDVTGVEPYTTGVDLARTANYTVAATLDSEGMLVGFFRTRGGTWAAMKTRLKQYLDPFPGNAYLDSTRDNKVVEDLARELQHVDVTPVRFTPQAKADLIENLAARLETEDIILPAEGTPATPRDTDVLLAELDSYQYDTTPSGNVRYGPPEGHNDDAVDALALAAKHHLVARSTW